MLGIVRNEPRNFCKHMITAIQEVSFVVDSKFALPVTTDIWTKGFNIMSLFEYFLWLQLKLFYFVLFCLTLNLL